MLGKLRRLWIVEHFLVCYSVLIAYIIERKILKMNGWHFHIFILFESDNIYVLLFNNCKLGMNLHISFFPFQMNCNCYLTLNSVSFFCSNWFWGFSLSGPMNIWRTHHSDVTISLYFLSKYRLCGNFFALCFVMIKFYCVYLYIVSKFSRDQLVIVYLGFQV